MLYTDIYVNFVQIIILRIVFVSNINTSSNLQKIINLYFSK